MSEGTFLVKLPFRAESFSPERARDVVAELLAVDARDEVLSAWGSFESKIFEVLLLIEAEDLRAANRAATRLLADAREGLDWLLRAEDSGHARETSELGRLVLASDLDAAVEQLDAANGFGPEHLPVRLPQLVRQALGLDLCRRLGDADGVGQRVRLGRIWSQFEARPDGVVPWRVRNGLRIGMPASTDLATLAGIRFEVAAGEAEALLVELAGPLADVGWTAVDLGPLVEVWHAERGFVRTLGARPMRTNLGLFAASDPLDLVWFFGTTGADVGASTEEVVARLQRWRESTPFVLLHADSTRVELRFERVPDDLSALAAEVMVLCPEAHAEQAGSLPRGGAFGRSELSHKQLAADLSRSLRLTLEWP